MWIMELVLGAALGASALKAMIRSRSDERQKARIEERAKTLRVVVYAGNDPVTGRRTYLRETIKGTDKAAYKRAEKALTKLLAQVDSQRSAPSTVSLSFALNEWMRTSEIADSTRHTYQSYIDRTINPALGDTAVNKISARMLEGFYTELRRCRSRWDGKPFVREAQEAGRPRLRCRGMSPARLQADGDFNRPPGPRHHQRHARRRRALGLDQLQPSSRRPQASPEASRTRPAHAG